MSDTLNLTLCWIFLYICRSWGYSFIPDDTKEITNPRIPALYDISLSQTLPYKEAPISGFWASSFLTATNGNQFFLATGLIASQSISAYGASILDLTTLQRYSYFHPASFSNTDLETFNFSTKGYEFSGLPPDYLNMKLHSTDENVIFDINVHATSPAFYYCGTGAYKYVNDTMYNWAFPASRTSGSITLPPLPTNDAPQDKINLNPSASLTWYDRVWGAAELRKGNSTFFNLYFDNSDLILWTPLVDSYDPPFTSRSSNIRARGKNWHELVPVDVFELNSQNAWTSPKTGLAYPQEWRLGIEGRGSLLIRSVVGDQEFAVNGGRGGATYIGFVTFHGVFDGRDVTGFGAVELRLAALV